EGRAEVWRRGVVDQLHQRACVRLVRITPVGTCRLDLEGYDDEAGVRRTALPLGGCVPARAESPTVARVLSGSCHARAHVRTRETEGTGEAGPASPLGATRRWGPSFRPAGRGASTRVCTHVRARAGRPSEASGWLGAC